MEGGELKTEGAIAARCPGSALYAHERVVSGEGVSASIGRSLLSNGCDVMMDECEAS